MKLFKKILVSLIVGALVGMLYAYENPDHKYFMKIDGKRNEIVYEAYQKIKKENLKYEVADYIHIFREDVLNTYRILLSGGLAFIGMFLTINLLQSVELNLKKS